MKTLIKLWLITLSTSIWAFSSYRIGYFDQAKPTPLKVDAVNQWLRDGLRRAGLKTATRLRTVVINATATDAQLKALDLLVVRGDLETTRQIGRRFADLGGWGLVSDRWTREDLRLEKIAVMSVALALEKRQAPLAGWLQLRWGKQSSRGAYLRRSDSDLDKIWFYEFLKMPALQKWTWSEILLDAKAKPEFKSIPGAGDRIVINRADPSVLDRLREDASEAPVVMAVDPLVDEPSPAADAYFQKTRMNYVLTTYPRALTDETRAFEREFPDVKLTGDVQLRDALLLVGSALGRSTVRVDSSSRFFAALDGLKISGASGEIEISRGQMKREVFVVGVRGAERVLDWRSGIVK